MRYLVLDIETIRHEAIWSPPEEKPAKFNGLYRPPAEAGQERAPLEVQGTLAPPPRDPFAPPHAWRPIVIGCVLLEDTFDRERQEHGIRPVKVGAIDPPKDHPPDAWEKALLTAFEVTMQRYEKPELVTWNGRQFDVPCLMLRSLRYGIARPWYYAGRDRRYRYSEGGHCDLADAMGDYGATRHLSLDGMAKVIGLPGKFGDIDGPKVGEAFAAGRHKEIASYCVSDAVQTAALFLRWWLLKGDLSLASYRTATNELLAMADASEHLTGFSDRVDRSVLLLEDLAPANDQAPPPASGPEAPAPEAA